MVKVSNGSRQTVGVAVVGCGIVGSAVVDALLHNAPLFLDRAGARVALRHVVVRDIAKAKAAGARRSC